MSFKAGGVLIAVCVLCGSLCLLGAGPDAALGEPSPAVVEARSILFEAFVVEVNMPALAEQGVSPIGRQPHSVAVGDILKCLDDGQAQVIGGNKIAARAGGRTNADSRKTIYVRKAGPQVSYSSYASGGKLGVAIESAADDTVTADFSFSATRFAEKRPDEDAPPVTENWEWAGAATLCFGEPQIGGATQDGQIGVFLILVANDQGR